MFENKTKIEDRESTTGVCEYECVCNIAYVARNVPHKVVKGNIIITLAEFFQLNTQIH